MALPPLKTVFFDIDDTLYSTTDFTRKARYNAIDEMIRVGLDYDREACYRILSEIINEFSSNDNTHFNKLLNRLPAAAKAKANDIILIAAGVSGYHNTKFVSLKPFPDVKKFIPRIEALPVHTGIISAGAALKQAEKLVRLDLEQYFEPGCIFITQLVGIGKSNVKLFEYACEKADTPPTQAMYVGDNPSTDVDVAKKAGLITVLRQGSGKHAQDPAEREPDFCIQDFSQLYRIITEGFTLTGA